MTIFLLEVIGTTNTCDFGGRVEQRCGQLACHQIGFIALRHRQQHIGIFDTGLAQHRGMRAKAMHGAQIEAILQILQLGRIDIHDGNIVGLPYQIFCYGCAHLAGAKNHDFHGWNTWREGKSGILCL